MDSKKLKANLETLKKKIPKKPKTKLPVYPKNISESLQLYLRHRTIDVMRYACWIYDEHNWPLPLYVNPAKIKIGYLNEFMFTKLGMNDFKYFDLFGGLRLKIDEAFEMPRNIITRCMWLLRYHKRKKLEYFDYLIVPLICRFFGVTNISTFNIELFNENYDYLSLKIIENQILQEKRDIVKEIFANFKKGRYASCITSIYPILDFLTRRYFDTKDFGKDMVSVNAMFKAAGFGEQEIDNLKPGAATRKLMVLLTKNEISRAEYKVLSEKHEHGLGFAGMALSSFLTFSNQYYGYYRSEKGDADVLNRHSILHGANNDFGTKINAIKLITYLYLTLELEPVLKILFKNK
ncbi:hypothetical protein [Pedobacter miscanthi]|uniref:Uncharacterized protein n=1 Tax=Pedobacter miscanthi TaxID=2259170 RepID=A0A366KZN7_9SPHI|nr:hypothetical protein [Pedobacter miscanthi]RBQ06703.1 hypothetical protein DRW42_13030 [Pedobacter miscanthi]